MIILDLNQVMISNFMAQIGNHTDVKIDEGLFRHMVLNSIRSFKSKFVDYGELIIACDDKNIWRKQIFPQYKANRKKDREKSEIDWSNIFTILNKVRDELKVNSPYRVLQIDHAEADDIIGTLVHKFGNMLNTGEKILILSGDKDFAQLHIYGNVSQYDPVRKKFITHNDPVMFTRELILKGDRGDGIPNILSHDNCIVNGERQKPLRVEKYVNITNPREHFKGDMLKNWLRNESLIDLSLVPQNIQEEIISEYEKQAGKPADKLEPYLAKFNLKTLSEKISDFL